MPAPRHPFIRWALLPLRIALGLLVLGQALFLFGLNILEIASDAPGFLRKQRDFWEQRQRDEHSLNEKDEEEYGAGWDRARRLPVVGAKLEEWLNSDRGSDLDRTIEEATKYTRWWALKSGQEQGWGLFAPNTSEFDTFIRVEMRWDDDPDPIPDRARGGPVTPEHEPLLIKSDNEPDDIHAYLRLGKMRLRRYESAIEVALRYHKGETRESRLRRWEDRIRAKVHGDEDTPSHIARYLDWKLKRFKEEHPNLPQPRQVILRSITWTIPKPPGPRPWDWEEEGDEPLLRWRPGRHAPRGENLELYLHTRQRFENKTPTP